MSYRKQAEQLEASLQTRVDELCAEAEARVHEQSYDDAVLAYTRAFALLPRPVERWEVANTILTAIGNALFLKGDFNTADDPFSKVMYTAGAVDNPFIRLRRGQVAFERGKLDMAEQELAAAYMLEGEQIFATENPKYLEFLQPKLLPPEVE